MKRLFLLVLFWILAATPATADCNGICTYLPIIALENPCSAQIMSDWKLITPESTTNKVMNPSGEIAGNFAAAAGTTVTRVTTFQHYGLYSYRVESNANNEGAQFTLSALTNAIHYVTVRVRGTLPASWDWSLNNATFTAPTLLEQLDSNWALYGLQFPATQANGATTLYIYQNGAGSGDFYLDGIQVEAKDHYTTYCDGTQEGCAWDGAANASTSQRSAASRAGGLVEDLQDDYGLNIGAMVGAGAAPQSVGLNSYAVLPGGELNNIKVMSRTFTITGVISGTTMADYHAKRQALKAALDNSAYPNNRPVKLRYNGAAVHKEIGVYYDGGLEGELAASDPCFWERVAVRFIAPDPYWKEIGESAAVLDTNDSATFRYVAGRLRSTGQWSALGPPGAGGTYSDVRAIAEDATYIYIGGDFTNFDGIAAADNIVRYNKQTGVYSAMGTGANDAVFALAVGPDGSVYAGGIFTLAGGVANTPEIARWDGSAWNAMSTGATGGEVDALIFGHSGLLYLGGSFSSAGGVATTDSLASWNGTAFAAVGTGVNGTVSAFAVAPDGTLYLGGSFTSAGGVANTLAIAAWNGTAFSALSTGVAGGGVQALAVRADGTLYLGGGFTSAGGDASISKIASWNGTTFNPLGSGVGVNPVYTLAVGADNIVYLGGFFTSAGGITLADRVARWNGYTFSHLDVDLPGTPIVYSVLASKYVDPVVEQQYSLYLGFDTTGTGNFAGKATVTNDGTAPAYPKIIFSRSGGTSAIIETLKNERTGREILLNYSLLSGESLTIDLEQTQRSIVSNFFGGRLDAALPNSDFGTWNLLKDTNDITCFVAVAGSPTVVGYLLWRDSYDGYD